MADFIRTEEKVVNVGEPVVFENNTDSDFSVSAAVVFRKSGLYDVSIVGRKTIISKLSEIIRCKDCKYCDKGIDEDGNPFLKCLGRVYGGTQEEDFCSHAERRTDGVYFV